MEELVDSAGKRFDIDEEGTFLAPKAGEIYKAAGAIASGALTETAAVVFLYRFILMGNDSNSQLNRGNEYIHGFFDLSFNFIFIISLLLVSVVIFVLFAVIVRLICKGNRCFYNASGEVFSFEYGGKKHIYKYADVSGVFFEPMVFMGKLRGYTITICTAQSAKEICFKFKKAGAHTPEQTPFWILHIRSAKLRAEKAISAPPEPKRKKYWHS